jgi:4-hydroxy-tetrahydrodipicolinate reductase
MYSGGVKISFSDLDGDEGLATRVTRLDIPDSLRWAIDDFPRLVRHHEQHRTEAIHRQQPVADVTAAIRICVAGITGWTGRAVADAVEAATDLELVSGVSRSDPASFSSVAEALDAVAADVLVDYTHAAVVKENVLAAVDRDVAAVVGSSGMSAADYGEIDARAKEKRVGVIAAGNFSLTAALLLRSALEAARHLDAWEVIDYASAGKQDAPSGTARELAERLENVRAPSLGVPLDETHGAREARGANVAGTQVHSVRLPSFTVSTEVVFAAEGERLSIRHDAGESPAPYVAGTLLAIRAVQGRVGLLRGLDQLLA